MAQYHYTEFGMTCLNDTNVDDTEIPSNMAVSLSFGDTTISPPAVSSTSELDATGPNSAVVQASDTPGATIGTEKQSIGLQKQGNKIA